MQIGITNPKGAQVYRRSGTSLVRVEEYILPEGSVVTATGVEFESSGLRYTEVHTVAQQDTLSELYVLSTDASPHILLP